MSETGGFLELKQRVVYSLFRAAVRVALRVRMPLKQLVSLLQMAYFQEAREEQGHTLDTIAELFGKSLRTVSTLHHRYRGDFFAPERDVALRRAIAALVNHAPADWERLTAAFPDLAEVDLVTALDDLVAGGTLVHEGDQWRRNPDAHEFTGDELERRVDGLNRQLDVLAETVWHRLVHDDAEPAMARSYVFHASDDDLRALLEAVERLARERAIAADHAVEITGEGRRFGLTFAAAPLPEEAP